MRILFRVILFIFLISGVFLQAGAQVANSLYFMKGVPQSNRINPARQPECGFYFGIPTLAPLNTVFASSSLSWDDIIYPHPSEDSLITFLHPLGDKEKFLNNLKPLNFIVSEVGTGLFSMGFRTNIGFFSMDVASRVDGSIYFPGDILRLLLEGADEGEEYNFDGLGTDLSGFEEVALGWSGAIGNKIQIGARAKLLFGLANLSTSSSDFSLNTSEEFWHVSSHMEFKASLPFAEVLYDEDRMIEDIIMDEGISDLDPVAIARMAFNKRNFGMGIDLGVDYRPSERWLLSASVLDLGYIQWKDEVHEISYNREYDYTGAEVDPFEFTEDNTFADFIDSTLSAITDTLLDALEMNPGEKYSRRLNSKLFLGASWYAAPGISFGLLSRTDFLKETIVEQVTASANFRAGQVLHFTLSYSYMNSYFKNFGSGISLHFGPLNIYAISDNVLNILLWPQESRSASLWFGMNMVLGYRQFSKKANDRPLVY